MERILFTKTGILCSIWDHKLSKWSEVDLIDSQIPFSWFLPYSVEVEDGVTILDILNNLKAHWDHVNYVFVNPLMGIKMDELMEALAGTSKKDHSNVNSICLTWTAELERSENSGISMYPTIMGVAISEEDEEDEFHDLYDLSINDILNQPLIIDDWLEVIDSDDPVEPVLDGAYAWSLYDFLTGILSEISVFSYSYGIISLPEGVQTSPISMTELMTHIDDIDRMLNEEGQA